MGMNNKKKSKSKKHEKVIGLFKDKLGGKIMEDFCTLRAIKHTHI